MLAKIGHKVRELTRIKFGPLTLARLRPGEFRELTNREVRALREWADRKPASRSSSSESDDDRKAGDGSRPDGKRDGAERPPRPKRPRQGEPPAPKGHGRSGSRTAALTDEAGP